MRIEPNTPSRSANLKGPEHIRSGASAVHGSVRLQAETVELSQLNVLLAYLGALPEDRKDLIGTVQQRLADGYYESVDVAQKVATLLMQSEDWFPDLYLDSPPH